MLPNDPRHRYRRWRLLPPAADAGSRVVPEGAILRTDGDNVSIYVPMMMMDSAPPAAPHGDPMTNPTEPDADPRAAKMEREAALLEAQRLLIEMEKRARDPSTPRGAAMARQAAAWIKAGRDE